MAAISSDLKLALDRVAFARSAGLELDPWQEDVLRSKSKRILMNCARQTGKTTIAGALALHTALYTPRSFSLIFAPSLDQSLEFFRRVTELAHNLGMENLDPEALRKTGLELKNGSRIEARPGSEKTARGRTAGLILIDEAARIDDQLYLSLRPMLAVTQGSLVMLSTPWGKRGAFYEAWVSEEYLWERYLVTAYNCPRISPEFLEEERRSMPQRNFEMEYLCIFHDSRFQLFTSEAVEQMFSDDLQELEI
jgi:phage terminase large subunit-like protein